MFATCFNETFGSRLQKLWWAKDKQHDETLEDPVREEILKSAKRALRQHQWISAAFWAVEVMDRTVCNMVSKETQRQVGDLVEILHVYVSYWVAMDDLG